MSIETMKLALDALEYLDVTAEHYVDDRIPYAAITALRQAIEQKQEPDVSNKLHFDCEFVDGTCADLTVYGSERDIKRLEARIKFWWNLEQAQKQEPVAWATRDYFYRELDRSVEHVRKEMEVKSVTMRCKDYDLALPIIDTHFGRVLVGQVATPPQRQPLTDEQILKTFQEAYESNYGHLNDKDIKLARAIEAAHGIKGEE